MTGNERDLRGPAPSAAWWLRRPLFGRLAGLGRAAAAVGLVVGLVVGSVAGLLAGCDSLSVPNKVLLKQADLQTHLERQFPLDRKVFDVLDVHVAVPVLTLEPDRNRVATAFDVALKDRLFGGRYHAHMLLDCALRVDPQDQTLRLADVTVPSFSAESGSQSLHLQAQRVGGLLAEQLLKDLVVYRLKPDQVERLARLGKQVDSVKVVPGGIEIGLAAVRAVGTQ